MVDNIKPTPGEFAQACDPGFTPTVFKSSKWKCQKHGVHEYNYSIRIGFGPATKQADWCVLCLWEALDRIGVSRLERVE